MPTFLIILSEDRIRHLDTLHALVGGEEEVERVHQLVDQDPLGLFGGGAAAQQGRDKVTFVISPAYASLGVVSVSFT